MQFAGVDLSSPPVIDIPRQCMELLDLEKPTLWMRALSLGSDR